MTDFLLGLGAGETALVLVGIILLAAKFVAFVARIAFLGIAAVLVLGGCVPGGDDQDGSDPAPRPSPSVSRPA